MAFLVMNPRGSRLESRRGKGEFLHTAQLGAKKKHHGKKDRAIWKSQKDLLAQHSSDTEIVVFLDPTPPRNNQWYTWWFFTTCLKSMARRIASYNPSQEIIELKPPRIILPILLYGCFLKWWYPHFTPQNGHF